MTEPRVLVGEPRYWHLQVLLLGRWVPRRGQARVSTPCAAPPLTPATPRDPDSCAAGEGPAAHTARLRGHSPALSLFDQRRRVLVVSCLQLCCPAPGHHRPHDFHSYLSHSVFKDFAKLRRSYRLTGSQLFLLNSPIKARLQSIPICTPSSRSRCLSAYATSGCPVSPRLGFTRTHAHIASELT